jgi:large subunit ribosomal protein L28
MARRCALTGKEVQFGCNVSHSMRHTNRRFEPNIQKVAMTSDTLGRTIRLRVAARTIRTVQKKGGLDGFLLGTDDRKLMPEALKLKRQIKKKLSGVAKKPAN